MQYRPAGALRPNAGGRTQDRKGASSYGETVAAPGAVTRDSPNTKYQMQVTGDWWHGKGRIGPESGLPNGHTNMDGPSVPHSQSKLGAAGGT